MSEPLTPVERGDGALNLWRLLRDRHPSEDAVQLLRVALAAAEQRGRDEMAAQCARLESDREYNADLNAVLAQENARLREALKAMLDVRPLPHSQLEVPVYVMARAVLAGKPASASEPPKKGQP